MNKQTQIRTVIFGRGDPKCLHCAVNYAIAAWTAEHAPRSAEGIPEIHGCDVINALMTVAADFINAGGGARGDYVAYAVQQLSAALSVRADTNVVSPAADAAAFACSRH